MISRDRVIRTLNFKPIDRARAICGFRPAPRRRGPTTLPKSMSASRQMCCTWKLAPIRASGIKPIARQGVAIRTPGVAFGRRIIRITRPRWPVRRWRTQALAAFQPPGELLHAAVFFQGQPAMLGHGKVYVGGIDDRPLERLCQLRGPETALRELGEGNVESRDLLARLHDFYRREAELWAKTDVDGLVLGDDLSWTVQSQGNLGLSQAIVKPLFCDCCSILHVPRQIRLFLAPRLDRRYDRRFRRNGRRCDSCFLAAGGTHKSSGRIAGPDRHLGRRGEPIRRAALATGRYPRCGAPRPQGGRFWGWRNHQPDFLDKRRPLKERRRLL